MGAEDIASIVRNAVRACINPTDLSAPWPHGGTGLGALRGAYAAPGIQHVDVTAEEWGVEVVEAVYVGESWTIGLLLRQYDDDVAATVFPNVEVGSDTGKKTIYQDADATYRAGSKASSKAVTLLLTARDVRSGTNSKAILFHRALPMIEASAQIRHSLTSEMTFPAVFRAIRATDGRTYQYGDLADLELQDLWHRALTPGAAALYVDTGPYWQDSARTVPATEAGHLVRVWDDVSGNGRHAVAPDEGSRLSVAATGGLELPASGTRRLIASLGLTASSWSMQAVLRVLTGADSNRRYAGLEDPDGNSREMGGREGPGGSRVVQSRAVNAANSGASASGGSLADDTDAILYHAFSGGALRSVALDGDAETGNVTSVGPAAMSTFFLGSTAGQAILPCAVKALVVYPFTLGTDRRAANNAILAARYGITLP